MYKHINRSNDMNEESYKSQEGCLYESVENILAITVY